MELVAVLIEDEHLLGPGLVDLPVEEFAYLVRIFFVDVGLLDVHDAPLEILADVEYSAAAEGGERKQLRILVADLVVVGVSAVLSDAFEGDFGIRVLDFLDHVEVLVDLTGSLVDIHDHVEVVGRTVGLGNLGEEHVLEDLHHHRTVDVLLLLEVLERINERYHFLFFHQSYLFFYRIKHFIRLVRSDAHGTYRQGIILDVAVEGRENSPVDELAVRQVHASVLPVYRHFEDIVIVVEVNVHEDAAALRGRILHHFLKKVSFHSNKKEDLPGLPSLSLCKDTK